MASWTLAQLTALEAGIAAGTTSISYEGRSVVYRDLDQMLRIRALMRQDLGLTPRSATVLAQHSRGFVGGSSSNNDI